MSVIEVDVRGLECPRAITEALKRVAEARVGDIVMVVSDSVECVRNLASSIVRLGVGQVSLERGEGIYRLRIVKLSSSVKPSDYAC